VGEVPPARVEERRIAAPLHQTTSTRCLRAEALFNFLNSSVGAFLGAITKEEGRGGEKGQPSTWEEEGRGRPQELLGFASPLSSQNILANDRRNTRNRPKLERKGEKASPEKGTGAWKTSSARACCLHLSLHKGGRGERVSAREIPRKGAGANWRLEDAET